MATSSFFASSPSQASTEAPATPLSTENTVPTSFFANNGVDPDPSVLPGLIATLNTQTATATQAADTATNAATQATQAATTATGVAGSVNALVALANDTISQAQGSAATATSKASEAASSASAAAASVASIGTSVTDAAGSATAASGSASAASSSATLAQQWATQTSSEVVSGQGYGAKKYAQDAATSASLASTSATNSATSATSSANSATAAGNSASSASTSATNAATSASSAASSATTATTQASAASSSATSAATSATNAASSASAASTSATNAASSATSAANSATLAASYTPSQTGNSGKFLTTNGTNTSWATVDAFPTQTGNSGKFLTTNGTAVSWGTVPVPDLSSPGAIGGTTPAAGTFTTLKPNTAILANANGAIDLAAGSSGVNISNGGTVTAITRTGIGTGYTSSPTVAIAAPTTAGGVQATATVGLRTNTATVSSGGSGYTVGDTLTVVGGTGSPALQLTVATLSGSAVATVTIANTTTYTVAPTNPASVTGGTGTGATFTLDWGVASTFTITNAGSGYVEQPTVSFSGGGGSGAAAYATVGGTAKVTGIGAQTDFYTPSGAVLSTLDGGLAGTGGYLQLTNSSASNSINRAIGSGSNIGIYWLSKGTGPHAFATNNSSSTVQFNVAHTASAVNYVQVTGAATGNRPAISAQGSDANIGLQFISKGTGTIRFDTRGGNGIGLLVGDSGSATNANYIQITGAATTISPTIAANGTDTNIDLALTPKGTGVVRGNGVAISAENGIFMNNATINTSMTIPTGYNASSAGPVTVASGVTVTVSSGSVWTIV